MNYKLESGKNAGKHEIEKQVLSAKCLSRGFLENFTMLIQTFDKMNFEKEKIFDKIQGHQKPCNRLSNT